MGCGASSPVVSKNGPVTHTVVSQGREEGTFSHSHHEKLVISESTTIYNKSDGNGTALPPPRPPDQSLEELLRGKEEQMKQMDLHADGVPFAKAMEQGHEEFTKDTLIPHDTMTKKKTVKFVDAEGQSSEDQNTNNVPRDIPGTAFDADSDSHGADVPAITITQPTPRGPSTASDPYDQNAAEMLIEKHRKDKELVQNKMDMDKMRHNITLQEKLAKRKELKRKQALAQGAVNAEGPNGDVSNEDAALTAQQIAGVAVTTEGVEGVATEGGSVSGVGDAAVAFVALSAGADVDQDKYNEVMAEEAPLPTAPETRKEVIYGNEDNIELFKDLEDFAINMEQISSPAVTFAILMESLLISQLSDLEKVRILFHWITAQNLNTINFPSNINEDTPMGFLFAIKSDRKTYAELFCRLCSAAGLHAKVIRGYLKGVGYMPDYKFTGANDSFRGSWNAVLIDGQWRLIDTHWGARHVVEEDDVMSQEYETVYKYEEHYFLTNPDQLIVTHFPDEKDWQLLAKPVTLEEFQDMVKLWPLFCKSKLGLSSHQTGVIVAPLDGVVEIRFKMSEFARRDMEMKCDFMTKQRKRNLGQFNLSRYSFHYVEGDYQVFQVHVPASGEYLLKLFGMSKKFSDENVFTNVALYQINCPKLEPAKQSPKNPLDIQPSEIRAPFPEVNNPYGAPFGNSQLTPMSHKGPIISCDKDGEATLIMRRLGGKGSRFMQQLHGTDQHEPLPDRAVHFTASTKEGVEAVVFRIRTPGSGNYSLTLYADDGNSGNETFNSFCSYFIASQAQTKPAPPFPTVANGALGPSPDAFHKMGHSLVSYNRFAKKADGIFLSDYGNAWVAPDENHESAVSFSHTEPINVIAELQGNTGYDLKNSVLVEDTGKRATIIVHARKCEPNAPEYLLRVYAGPSTQTAGIPVIFNAFVQAPNKEASQLPQSPVKRWGPTGAFATLCEYPVRYGNSQPLFSVATKTENEDPSCCRLYQGGEDLLIRLAMKTKLNIKSSFSSIDSVGNYEAADDRFCILSSADASTATLRLRIPKSGNYCLSLFGSPQNNQSGQMSSLINILVTATSPSAHKNQFPRSYGLWSANSVNLLSPMSKDLKRNSVNKIALSMANLTATDTGFVSSAFPGVLLLTDTSVPAYPNTTDDNTHTYEWDYVPGPGEKHINVVVQQNPGDTSLSYVLQFDVVN